MSNRRMLSKSISTSIKIADLKTLHEKLLFTWMIPHADDDGRLQGDPRYIRAIVFPMENCTVEDINNWLKSLSEVGLIIWFEADGEKIIQIAKWNDHQQIRRDRYTPSKLPSYDPHVHRLVAGCQPCDTHLETSGLRNEIQINEIKDKKIQNTDDGTTGEKIPFETIIQDLNQKAGTHFRSKNRKRSINYPLPAQTNRTRP